MLQNYLLAKKAQTFSMAVGFQTVPKPPGDAPSQEHRAALEGVRSPIIPLMQVERQAILEALAYTRGDRAVAANLLGIGRTTLYRKLKEYQLAG
jgi:DNA-binding NtrC family response regulator